nr:leucine-rich repeat protein [uncultured Acetatifactor sp.]
MPEAVALPVEDSAAQEDTSLPAEDSMSQDDDSLPAGDSATQDDASSPAGDSATQDDASLSAEDSATQDDDSLPAEDSASQDDDSSPVEDSAPQDDDSLPVEDSAAQEKDTLSQEILLPRNEVSAEESSSLQAAAADVVPTPAQAYAAMIALKDQDAYKEGTTWTNDEPYSDSTGYYKWKGGPLDGHNISAVGCVAFAFILSDAAFGNLPARMYAQGAFTFEDIKVGDILRVSNDTHTVIVLEVNAAGVVVAEGNISTGDHKGKVHWGRGISKEEVMRDTSHYITRYPEGYIPPDDPSANESIGSGTLDGGLTWNLTKAGTLTISGSGAMPDFSSAAEQPWRDNSSEIRSVIIENGVTTIGACAFWESGILGVEIPSSVTMIGNSAFRKSSIISVTIPSGVKTIGDSAFRECANLSSVNVSEGVEKIDQNAFRACARLTSIDLPASIGEVGASAFFQCQALTMVSFAPGDKQVKLGDNLFTQCYYLARVTLPQSADRIGEGMFQNCLTLAGVEIPQGVESIGASAFASCSAFTTVIIPDSVTEIGIAAFTGCPLKDIYFTGTEAQWNSVSKIGDTAATVSKATMHYEYKPEPTPTPTETPEPSASPEPTATPGPSAPPEPTATPVPTQAPEPTAIPAPTTTPGSTASPAPTQAPDSTASPAPTQAPDSTASPAPTQAPIAPTPTPPSMVPSISGESGKEGWTAIKDEVANASTGEQISVEMNGASVVPGDVLDSVKGQDVTISFDMGGGIVWTVNGRDVTADHANDVDFSVQTGTSHIPQDMVDQVAGNRPTMQLSLAHNGDFGCSAVLTINVGTAYAGLDANLYYYNESAGGLEYVTGHQINEDGITNLTFTHASDYVIVVNKNATGESNSGAPSGGSGESAPAGADASRGTEALSPKTGEFDSVANESGAGELQTEESSLSLIWMLLIGAAGLAAAGALVHRRVNSRAPRA